VGLGLFGVVSEVTIQCVPAHQLLERTYVQTRAEVEATHADNLRNQHMRYMWIPHTDAVVVVASNPLPAGAPPPALPPPAFSEEERTRPLRELLLSHVPAAEAAEMGFSQLRDALLALAPLDKKHVAAVNQAEAEFWKRSQGERIDWSDRVLGFDCGGQQWVSEVAFPTGTRAAPSGADLGYMRDLLAMVEASDLPAPSPIEQRWSAGSRAPMSPAHSSGEDDLHCWVGIIMYLPEGEAEVDAVRARITKRFWEYNDLCRHRLWQPYGAHQHWAKIELPADAADVEVVRRRLRARFPVDELNAARRELDPRNILSNALLDGLLAEPAGSAPAESA
jgi:L-galactono-1,4-lactone dehydrogenase